MTRRATASDLPIQLDRGVPLHEALYVALRDAMLKGRLAPRMRLPATRDLAEQLSIARGTVVACYAQLASEGYLVGRAGSGTFVAERLPDRYFAALAARSGKARSTSRVARAPALSRWGQHVWSPFIAQGRRTARPFRPHIPAVDAFPMELWTRLLGRRARRDESLHLAEADVRGYLPLREELAAHLRVARGLRCRADQIVIVPSVQQVIDLVTRLTVEPGQSVWMEDPGYVGAHAVFQACRVNMVPVPVDAHGLDVEAGVRLAKDARLAYVTPGHQAPLGATLPIDRRLALLAWAEAHGAWILEDDYDSEYRYRGRPLPALQSLDRADVVVHTGTFSKTLLPTIRLAYVVLPDALIEPFIAAKSIVDRYTPTLVQAALADFIAAGHFGRHLRRMRELYAERRSALQQALERELGDAVEVVGTNAGLDLNVFLPAGTKEQRVISALTEVGIEAHALTPYYLRAPKRPGLILGFAAFSAARLQRSVAQLAGVLREAR
jgi:GntR family transcriptional regulator/MocR family aminotransferase